MKQDENSSWILSEKEVASFRTSPSQLLCVQMLQDGNHRSFVEFFRLLRRDRARRAAAEPGSPLSRQTPLEEQPDKLEAMREHLSRAEHAERNGSLAAALEQRLILGRCFSAPQDQWLAVHFYRSCTERQAAGRAATEARARLSELYLHTGDLQRARREAELCVQQERDSGWLDSDGRPLKLLAARAFWGAYSRMAASLEDAGDRGGALTLLLEGRCTCAEAGDKKLEAETTFQLGGAYQRAGDHGTARQFFHTCMQICGTLEDTDGLMEAYRATAQSLHSEGNIEETIVCLEKLADLSRGNNLPTLADTCLHLGHIYFTRAQYQAAYQYFLQAYTVSHSIGDVSLQDRAQVMLASARAHSAIGRYSADVASGSPDASSRLLAWKESRGGRGLGVDAAADWY